MSQLSSVCVGHSHPVPQALICVIWSHGNRAVSCHLGSVTSPEGHVRMLRRQHPSLKKKQGNTATEGVALPPWGHTGLGSSSEEQAFPPCVLFQIMSPVNTICHFKEKPSSALCDLRNMHKKTECGSSSSLFTDHGACVQVLLYVDS